MPRSQNPRVKLPAQRGAKRTGPIGSILPGDHTEVARDIQRLWLEVQRAKPFPPGVKAARVRSLVVVTDDYTADTWQTVLANGTFTVTLPTTGEGRNKGEEIVIKNSGTGTITISQFDATETIDGSTANVVLAAKEWCWLVANITGWWVIAGQT